MTEVWDLIKLLILSDDGNSSLFCMVKLLQAHSMAHIIADASDFNIACRAIGYYFHLPSH
jgi:hypothetical protein